jgi:hypothetical protein
VFGYRPDCRNHLSLFLKKFRVHETLITAPSECGSDRTRQRGSVARRSARTIEKQIARIGTAAALPVSVGRHLVSKSVQLGQSATGKTESDQWLLAAHLLSKQLRNLRCWLTAALVVLRHDHGQSGVLEQIWNTFGTI